MPRFRSPSFSCGSTTWKQAQKEIAVLQPFQSFRHGKLLGPWQAHSWLVLHERLSFTSNLGLPPNKKRKVTGSGYKNYITVVREENIDEYVAAEPGINPVESAKSKTGIRTKSQPTAHFLWKPNTVKYNRWLSIICDIFMSFLIWKCVRVVPHMQYKTI